MRLFEVYNKESSTAGNKLAAQRPSHSGTGKAANAAEGGIA